MHLKKVLPIVALFIIISLTPSSAYAYGEGGIFPPGSFNNPHQIVKLVCTLVKKQLPFNKTVYIPECHVVKVTVPPPNTKSLQDRINDLISRILHGHS